MEDLDQKFVGKYIGPNKIISVVKLSEGENAVYQFTVERVMNNKSFFLKKYLQERGLQVGVSDVSRDYTQDFEERANAMSDEMIDIAAKYNLDYTEVDLLWNTLKAKMLFHFDRAVSFSLYGDDARFAPGWNPLNDLSLVQAEYINAQIEPPPVENVTT